VSEKKDERRAFDKGAFYRTTRMLHAYLSAFAFIALIFFSVTGVLLNHPEWFENYKPHEVQTSVSLTKAEIDAAFRQKEPGRALAEAVGRKTSLPGAFSSEDIDGGQAIIRLDGPKGASDLIVDLEAGKADVRATKASFNSLMMDLHRGKNSGGPWRFLIDATAYIVLGLSILGYILFFSLRFRLKTSLVLTGVSLALLVGLIIWFVP